MKYHFTSDRIRSVQFSCAVMSNSLTPHGLQHARLHQLPDLAQTHVHRVVMTSNHLILCCSLLLLPSVIPCIVVFSSGSVLPLRWPKYQRFSISISTSKERSGLIPLQLTGWVSFQSKEVSRIFSNTTVQKHQLFGMVQLSHPYKATGKTIALTIQTFVGKVMSLLFNMLCRSVIAFLPRSKHLSI